MLGSSAPEPPGNKTKEKIKAACPTSKEEAKESCAVSAVIAEEERWRLPSGAAVAWFISINNGWGGELLRV